MHTNVRRTQAALESVGFRCTAAFDLDREAALQAVQQWADEAQLALTPIPPAPGPFTRWQDTADQAPLRPAPSYSANFDRLWGIAS